MCSGAILVVRLLQLKDGTFMGIVLNHIYGYIILLRCELCTLLTLHIYAQTCYYLVIFCITLISFFCATSPVRKQKGYFHSRLIFVQKLTLPPGSLRQIDCLRIKIEIFPHGVCYHHEKTNT